MEMEQRVVDRRVSLPVGKVKFDAHPSRISNGHANQFSRVLDNLKKYGLAILFTGFSALQGPWILRLSAGAAEFAAKHDVDGAFELFRSSDLHPGAHPRNSHLSREQGQGCPRIPAFLRGNARD